MLVHGGMAMDVGPILEMVTEKYLLRLEDEWTARLEAMRIFDELVGHLGAGRVAALGGGTERHFFGPIQTIIPWASNYYTEALIRAVRADVLNAIEQGVAPHPASAPAPVPATVPAGELLLKLKKLRTLGSVLYVAAHPDDENTAMLAWLACAQALPTFDVASVKPSRPGGGIPQPMTCAPSSCSATGPHWGRSSASWPLSWPSTLAPEAMPSKVMRGPPAYPFSCLPLLGFIPCVYKRMTTMRKLRKKAVTGFSSPPFY